MRDYNDKVAAITGAGSGIGRAAETILKAVQRKARRVLVGPDAMILDKLQRLLPSGYGRILRHLLSR